MTAALLDHLWQSTAFALFAGALTLLLRKNSAAVRYWLWFAASVKFLVPFSLFSAIGSAFLKPVSIGFSAPFDFDFEPAARPFSGSVPVMAVPATSVNWMSIILASWALGTILVLATGLVRRVQLYYLVCSARPLAVTGSLPVRSCPSLLEPALVGIWRPVILLPDGIEAHLSPDEMRAMLEHELCHLRRHDNLTAMFHMLVEALFWFHPLVWWLEKRLVEERERACDERVLDGGLDPEIYAESILKVCKYYLRSPLGWAAGIAGASLSLRMEAIMRDREVHDLDVYRKSLLAIFAILTFAGPLTTALLQFSRNESAMVLGNAPEINQARSEQLPSRNKIIPYDPQLFDSYIGFYRATPWIALAVSRSGDHLLLDFPGLTKAVELFPESRTEFFANGPEGKVSFNVDPHGHVMSLLLPANGPGHIAPRISEGEAARIQAAASVRMRSNAPGRGTQNALRNFLASIERGRPDYDAMSRDTATVYRRMMPILTMRFEEWGALKTIEFNKTGPGGDDIFDVNFANARTQWSVEQLTNDGRITGIGFGPIYFRADPNTPAPGTEAALRHQIDSMENGHPDYTGLMPAPAANPSPFVHDDIRKFGALRTIRFAGKATDGMDTYEVTFANARTQWHIAPLTHDGRIDWLSFVVLF